MFIFKSILDKVTARVTNDLDNQWLNVKPAKQIFVTDTTSCLSRKDYFKEKTGKLHPCPVSIGGNLINDVWHRAYSTNSILKIYHLWIVKQFCFEIHKNRKLKTWLENVNILQQILLKTMVAMIPLLLSTFFSLPSNLQVKFPLSWTLHYIKKKKSQARSLYMSTVLLLLLKWVRCCASIGSYSTNGDNNQANLLWTQLWDFKSQESS